MIDQSHELQKAIVELKTALMKELKLYNIAVNIVDAVEKILTKLCLADKHKKKDRKDVE